MRPAPVLLLGILLFGVCDAVAPVHGRCQPGAAAFKAHCARCHGATGTTDPPIARALKVAPLQNDAALAQMTIAEIVKLVKADPKHQGVVDLRDADLESAALFVRQLARQRGP